MAVTRDESVSVRATFQLSGIRDPDVTGGAAGVAKSHIAQEAIVVADNESAEALVPASTHIDLDGVPANRVHHQGRDDEWKTLMIAHGVPPPRFRYSPSSALAS
jgi:hypothetical protein